MTLVIKVQLHGQIFIFIDIGKVCIMKIIKNLLKRCFSSISATVHNDLQTSIRVTNNLAVKSYKYEARRSQLIEHILHDTESGITTSKYTCHDIIVSLTSYGKRIHEVALTIESLMQQTMKPNRIVLWLDKTNKPQQLPLSLLRQQKRGLEICYCEDIRSYKKLIPQMLQTPEDAIITADDDILYDYDVLEHLIKAYLEVPNSIHCCRVHKIGLDDSGELIPYNQWESRCSELGANKRYFLTSGGGVLFPPDSLDSEVFNQEVFMSICPDADDVWFTAMALKKGTPISKVFTRNMHGEDYMENHQVLEEGLYYKNVMQNGNDHQLQAVFSKYSLYDKLFK